MHVQARLFMSTNVSTSLPQRGHDLLLPCVMATPASAIIRLRDHVGLCVLYISLLGKGHVCQTKPDLQARGWVVMMVEVRERE